MKSYDSRTIALHWASACLVLLLWLAGQTIDWFPRGDARVNARSVHIVLGLLLALVVLVRLHWRTTHGTRLPPADTGWSGRAAIGVHHLLYTLLLVLIGLGMASVWFRGDSIFGLFSVPAFDPTNTTLRRNAVHLHGLLANILLAVSALHAGAALWHHLVRKDGVLARMLPRLGN